MNRKIVVPEGMLKAAAKGFSEKHGMVFLPLGTIPTVLEAALLWLSENPIVPTDEQAEELWRHPKVLNGDEHYAKAMARDWQRRMFLAPESEIPVEVQALLFREATRTSGVGVEECNNAILEAFRCGQRSKL